MSQAPVPIPVDRLLTAWDLAIILGLAKNTIIWKSKYRPDEIPPRISMPWSRKALWHPDTVREWLAELASKKRVVSQEKKGPGRPRGSQNKTIIVRKRGEE